MLNRRYLRIKVLQALYSFYRADERFDLPQKEKELKISVDKIYDLYLYLILILKELRIIAERTIEEKKKKLLPTADDLNPSTRFINDPILVKIDTSTLLSKLKKERVIMWTADEDQALKKIYSDILASNEYNTYHNEAIVSFENSKQFIHTIYKKYISENETIKQTLFEKNIHWAGDYTLAILCVFKTLKGLKKEGDIELLPLYKADDDFDYMITLFRHTILDDTSVSALLNDKISNWDPERIAAIDMLLMKMAITEILQFPGIPVKVTLNEYIEISKVYSSPKSNTFINGILDAVVKDLRAQNKLAKTGRGLIE
jgi:transcription antitermination protein NusB